MRNQRKTESTFLPFLLNEPDTERAAIGMCFASTGLYREAMAGLTTDCFTLPETISCWNVLMQTKETKPEIHAVVAAARKHCPALKMADVSKWVFMAGQIKDAEGLISILHEYRRHRQGLDLLSRKAQDLMDMTIQATDIFSAVESELSEIRASNYKKTTDAIEYFEILSDIIEIQKNIKTPSITTFLSDLNLALSGGFEPGTLTVIGARPGVGKTALTMWWLWNWTKVGIPCGFISMEMTDKQMARRELAMETGIPYSMIKQGRLNTTENREIEQAAYRLKENRFHRSSVGNCDIHRLRSEMTAMHYDHGCKVIVIDYLQRMSFEGKDNRVALIGAAVNQIKAIAVQYGISVVLLSQLSRDSEKEKEPKIYHLRDSGMIEEAADVIMLLHRPDMVEEQQTHQLHFLIEKNRDGESNTEVIVHANMATNTFGNERIQQPAF